MSIISSIKSYSPHWTSHTPHISFHTDVSIPASSLLKSPHKSSHCGSPGPVFKLCSIKHHPTAHITESHMLMLVFLCGFSPCQVLPGEQLIWSTLFHFQLPKVCFTCPLGGSSFFFHYLRRVDVCLINYHRVGGRGSIESSRYFVDMNRWFLLGQLYPGLCHYPYFTMWHINDKLR